MGDLSLRRRQIFGCSRIPARTLDLYVRAFESVNPSAVSEHFVWISHFEPSVLVAAVGSVMKTVARIYRQDRARNAPDPVSDLLFLTTIPAL